MAPSSADPLARSWPARSVRMGLLWTHLTAGAVFAVAGALFVASATASEDGDLRVDRTGGLPQVIAARAEMNAQLQQAVDQQTLRVESLSAAGGPRSTLADTTRRIAEISPQVGLTEVIGPGISVSLDDAQPPPNLPKGFTGDDYIVHQEDVQGVVNALWRGGAAAVTVMGQRLISTSAVRCVGNTVILQGQVYSPPFIIEAVGDVTGMTAALDADGAVQFFREWSEVVGLGYSQTERRSLTIPAYTGPTTTSHSQVLQDPTAGDDA